MKCQDVQQALDAQLVGTLGRADAEALDAHLATCPECRAMVADVRRLQAELRHPGTASTRRCQPRLHPFTSPVERRCPPLHSRLPDAGSPQAAQAFIRVLKAACVATRS